MMAYDKKFVVSVIVDGKPLRELNVGGNRTATIPFGSEYVLRLKNKNKVRAMAAVSIDGTDVLCGKKLIIGPNETVDLERFVDDNDGGSKFKFISIEQGEVTGEIQDPDNVENGRIAVTFQKELEPPKILFDNGPSLTDTIFRSASFDRGARGKGIKLGSKMSFQSMSLDSVVGASLSDTTFATNSTSLDTFANTTNTFDIPQESKGATVEGSHSKQKFKEGESFDLELGKTVLEIFLKGPSLEKKLEFEWALFVEGESTPRAMHVNRSHLVGMVSSMILPEDKQIKFEKVFKKS